MKNKHRIKQGLALLLAGGVALTNLGAGLPAFAENAAATPETAQTATLDPDAAVLYADLPDAPAGSYIGSEGLPVATGQTKIGLSLWADGQLEQDSHLDPDALNSGDKTVTVPLTEDTDYAIVPLMAQVEYPADGSRTDVLLPENVTLLDYDGEPAQDTTVLHSEYGKKYHSNSKSYYTEVRALSDALCQKYGLSIIETPESLRGKRQYEKWRAEENNQPTWRTAIRQDVDEAIQQSLTWRQFLSAMERKGYEVRMGRKYPVLRPPGKERFVRFKTLGKRYTPEAIQTRILYPQNYRPYVEKAPSVQHGRLHSGKKPHRKLTGLRALYYRYLYELGALPRKPRRPSYVVRQDAYKLDQRIRQMEFLSKHNIDTLAQLETHRQALQTEIGQLLTKRKQLPKTDDVLSQCESVNTALKQLRQEERLCRKIAEHSLEVQQHLTEARRDRAEQQQREQEHERDRRPNIDLTL